jgi:hypothetical protein
LKKEGSHLLKVEVNAAIEVLVAAQDNNFINDAKAIRLAVPETVI